MSGDDVETQLMLLETPFGDGPHQIERERAAAWLLANAERAYPRILARLRTATAGAAVIELVASFGRSESIAPLARLLRSGDAVAWPAAQALAAHPQPAAGEALRELLASADPRLAVVAADALAARGDRGDCAALLLQLEAPDAGVRYHVTAAAAKLSCLSRETLEHLMASDPDAGVRALAEKLRDDMTGADT